MLERHGMSLRGGEENKQHNNKRGRRTKPMVVHLAPYRMDVDAEDQHFIEEAA